MNPGIETAKVSNMIGDDRSPEVGDTSGRVDVIQTDNFAGLFRSLLWREESITLSLSKLFMLTAACLMFAALAVACGTAAVQPEVHTAEQMQPADPEKPQAAQEGADPDNPQAPAEAAPAPTKVEGFKIGAVVPRKAGPTTVAMPDDTIKRGGILNQVHRRSPLHFRLDVRNAIDETSANAPMFNQLLTLQPPDFVIVASDLAHSW